MEGDDVDAIKRAQDDLMQASHKLAEMIYQQTQAGAGATAGSEAGGTQAGGGRTDSDDEVVDADFEEVK
jgi:molecular chaperone DnaK